MIERVLQFGSAGRLVGVLTLPRGVAAPVGAVWFNAGVIPRTGPHRLHVRLARRLAASGVAMLRFDLSARGDSRPGPGRGGFEAQALADIIEALDAIERECGVARFALGGLCAGADNSYAAAVADRRVVGLMLLDPWSWPTRGSRWRAFQARRAELGTAAALARAAGRVLRGVGRAVRRHLPGQHEAAPDPITIRYTPSREAFGRGLRALVDRGVAVHAIYSGSLGEAFNDAAQFAEIFAEFGLPGRVGVDWWPHANHTFTELAVQRELIERIVGWTLALSRVAPSQTAGVGKAVSEPASRAR